MKTLLTLSVQFSAAHFYSRAEWTPEKNRQIFGKCYSAHGHGHDYRLEASFDSPSISDTNLAALRKNMQQLHEALDHRHLNFEIKEFNQDQIPTCENIAWWCADYLLKLQPVALLKKIRLYERPDLFVDISL